MGDTKQPDKNPPGKQDKDCGCKSGSNGGTGKGQNGGQKGGTIPWCRLICQKGRQYTPWVQVRFDATDVGLRPLPANTNYWTSPDIWVESSDPYGRIVAGENNYVHAVVWNRFGRAPAFPTIVDFYWGNPSLGLGAATLTYIGRELAYIWDHHYMDVRCNTPWVPTFENGGHECLIVNTSAPINDPIQDPFQAWLDRHVGQRNVMVTAASAGQLIKLPLAAQNLFPLVAHTEFHARVEHLALEGRARDMHKKDILNAVANFGSANLNRPKELLARYSPRTAEARLAGVFAPAMAKRPTTEPVVRGVDGRRAAVASKLSAGAQLRAGETLGAAGQLFAATGTLSPGALVAGNHGDVLLHTIDLQPNEHRTLDFELQVPANAADGEFVVVHVVQSAQGVPVGGYTIIASVGKFLNV